jgi:hypothetical protein
MNAWVLLLWLPCLDLSHRVTTRVPLCCAAAASSLNPGEVFLAPAPSTCLPPAVGGTAPTSPRRSTANSAGGPGSTSGGGGAAGGERAALRPVVAALQARVYGPGGGAAAAASGDLVQDVAK